MSRDFSEAHDVAAEYPDRLKALRALFEVEAKKNRVYPLGNGLGDAALAGLPRPSLTEGRTELLYPGSTPRLQVSAAPRLGGSHRVTARIEVPAKGADGAIVALGGRYGGWALYVRGGRLVYESNFFGRTRTAIVSTEPLPTGVVEVGFELERRDATRWGGGTVRLLVGGRRVGEGALPQIGRPSSIDSFDIGADRGSPVSESYQAPATFTGRAEWVSIALTEGASH